MGHVPCEEICPKRRSANGLRSMRGVCLHMMRETRSEVRATMTNSVASFGSTLVDGIRPRETVLPNTPEIDRIVD